MINSENFPGDSPASFYRKAVEMASQYYKTSPLPTRLVTMDFPYLDIEKTVDDNKLFKKTEEETGPVIIIRAPLHKEIHIPCASLKNGNTQGEFGHYLIVYKNREAGLFIGKKDTGEGIYYSKHNNIQTAEMGEKAFLSPKGKIIIGDRNNFEKNFSIKEAVLNMFESIAGSLKKFFCFLKTKLTFAYASGEILLNAGKSGEAFLSEAKLNIHNLSLSKGNESLALPIDESSKVERQKAKVFIPFKAHPLPEFSSPRI